MPDQQLPAGAQPIDLEAVFATIGELYFQVRELRRAVVQQQQQQSQPEAANGAVHLDAPAR